ncbi:MAG: hypothetical protein ACTSQA_00565 [Candidatus Heimdallarchaeaceae archaeon]
MTNLEDIVVKILPSLSNNLIEVERILNYQKEDIIELRKELTKIKNDILNKIKS